MTSDLFQSFRLAPGFRAAGAACGLKESGALDLALVVADAPCAAAGVFTTNRVQAAPVVYDRQVLARGADRVRAVIANSGCANACTGEQGERSARRMAEITANVLRCATDQVLVLSTGVIGRQLDMSKLERGIPEVCALAAPEGAPLAARAILTTDTRPKVAAAQLAAGSRRAEIRGLAKGAGMIHPQMATLLAVVTTDAACSPALLHAALRRAADRSFNRLTVDGDRSTNDTVLLLASGTSATRIGESDLEPFVEALTRVCASLARQIARDGEGATKLVEIAVTGAMDEAQAHRVADAVARSLLVKTAIHGSDPNWGRVLAAAGGSGAELRPERLALWFGDGPDALQLVARGQPLAYDERAASELLRRDPVQVRLDLGLSRGQATVWTCDLGAAYVTINADYRT